MRYQFTFVRMTIIKKVSDNKYWKWYGKKRSLWNILLFIYLVVPGLSCSMWDLLEKAMAIHSSTLAWKIPWAEEPDSQQPMWSRRAGHDWSNLTAAVESLIIIVASRIFSCGIKTFSCSMWDLVPWSRIGPRPTVLGAWSFKPWNTREVSLCTVTESVNWCSYHGDNVLLLLSIGSSQPRDWTQVSHIVGRFFTVWATKEIQTLWILKK